MGAITVEHQEEFDVAIIFTIVINPSISSQ
jgi:hypothetical protein